MGGVNGNISKLHCATFLSDNLDYLVLNFSIVGLLDWQIYFYSQQGESKPKLLFISSCYSMRSVFVSLFTDLKKSYIVHL